MKNGVKLTDDNRHEHCKQRYSYHSHVEQQLVSVCISFFMQFYPN